MQNQIHVFISYRRTNRHLAGRVEQQLNRRRFLQAFRDTQLPAGQDFPDNLRRKIRSSKCLILLVTRGALQRCSVEDDWVRQEIEEALRHGINIIPLEVDGASFVDECASLPSSLAERLRRFNALPLRDEAFEMYLGAVVDDIVMDSHNPSDPTDGSGYEPRTDQGSDGSVQTGTMVEPYRVPTDAEDSTHTPSPILDPFGDRRTDGAVGVADDPDLVERVWAGSDRERDLVRIATVFKPLSPTIVRRVCEIVRDEPEELVQTAFDDLVRCGAFVEERDEFPFVPLETAFCSVDEALGEHAIARENFSPALRRRYASALLDCIDGETIDGQWAAMMANHHAQSREPGFARQVYDVLGRLDWSTAGAPFLSALVAHVTRMTTPECERLATLLLAKEVNDGRRYWAANAWELGKRIAPRVSARLVRKLRQLARAQLRAEYDHGESWIDAAKELHTVLIEQDEPGAALRVAEAAAERVAALPAEDHDPDDLTLFQSRAVICLMHLERHDEARERAEVAGAPILFTMAIADYHDQHEQWAQALEWHSAVRVRDPENARALVRIVECLLAMEAIEQAEARVMAEGCPADVVALVAEAHHAASRWRPALDWWQRLRATSEESAAAVAAKLVRCHLQLGQQRDADALVAAHPLAEEVFAAYASFYHQAGQWQHALPWWQRLADLNGSLSDAAQGRIVACVIELEGLQRAADRAGQAGAPVQAAEPVASAYFLAEDWENAEQWWHVVLARGADSPARVRGFIAECTFQRGRVADVEALGADPEAPEHVLFVLANMFEKRRDWGRAARWHRQIAERFPQYREVAQGRLAQVLIEDQRLDEVVALAEARTASPVVWTVLAQHFHDRQAWPEATAYWKRAFLSTTREHDELVTARLVECYLRSGRPDAAATLAGEAPSNAIALAYARFHGDGDRWEEARDWLQRALATASDAERPELERQRLTCLLHLGHTHEAERMALATDAPVALSIAHAEYYTSAEEWEPALHWWSSVAARGGEEQARAEARRIRCLLQLNRAAEVAERLADPTVPQEALISAAQFFEQREDWAAAIHWWTLVGDRVHPAPLVAQMGLLRGLFRVGDFVRAREVALAPGAPIELLEQLSLAHEAAADPDAALPIHLEISARDSHRRPTALAYATRCLLKLGRLDEASALVADDAPPSAVLAVLDAYIEAKDWTAATTWCRWFASNFPDRLEEATPRLVTCLMALGHEDQALAHASAPDVRFATLRAMGAALAAQSRFVEALEWFDRAGEIDPAQQHLADFNRYECSILMGRIDDAERMAARDDAPIRMVIELGNLHHQAEDWDSALRWWDTLALRSPQHRDAAHLKALQCLLLSGEVARAEDRAVHPSAGPLLVQEMARYFQEIGPPRVAIEWWERLARVHPGSAALAEQGIVREFLAMGRIAEAEARADRRDAPPNVVVELAGYWQRKQQWARALQRWLAVADTPVPHEHQEQAWKGVVVCLMGDGRPQEARSVLTRVPRTAVVMALAEAHHERQDWSEALELWDRVAVPFLDQQVRIPDGADLDEALERWGPQAYQMAVECLMFLGDEASAQARALATGAPREGLDAMVSWLERRGRFGDCLPWIERVLDRADGEALVPTWCSLVRCLVALGLFAEAERRVQQPDAPVEAAVTLSDELTSRSQWERAHLVLGRLVGSRGEARAMVVTRSLGCLLAMADLEGATDLALRADLPEGFAMLAEHLETLEDWPGALAWWERCTGRGSKTRRAVQGVVRCLLRDERYEEAERWVAGDGDMAEVWVEFGRWHRSANRMSQAIPWYERLIVSGHALRNAAERVIMECLLEMGQEETALQRARRPEAPAEARLVVARYLQGEARWQEAVRWWRALDGEEIEASESDIPVQFVRCLVQVGAVTEAVTRVERPGTPPLAIEALAEHYRTVGDPRAAARWMEHLWATTGDPVYQRRFYRDELQIEGPDRLIALYASLEEPGLRVSVAAALADHFLEIRDLESLAWWRRRQCVADPSPEVDDLIDATRAVVAAQHWSWLGIDQTLTRLEWGLEQASPPNAGWRQAFVHLVRGRFALAGSIDPSAEASDGDRARALEVALIAAWALADEVRLELLVGSLAEIGNGPADRFVLPYLATSMGTRWGYARGLGVFERVPGCLTEGSSAARSAALEADDEPTERVSRRVFER